MSHFRTITLPISDEHDADKRVTLVLNRIVAIEELGEETCVVVCDHGREYRVAMSRGKTVDFIEKQTR